MAIAPPQIPGLRDWRPLARGGFATVWEARQESLNRLVAVKVDQRPLDAESEQRRFLREAGAAGRMSGHPGIVTVHDAGILADDRPYLVMELCPGGSLTRWLIPEARPTQRRVRDVGVSIADALAAAHARGVLHRDVKPANILIDAYDHPGLADFGLAALPEPGVELAETLEALTPAYAPPEAFEQQPPTEYGDVYGLAATLYALLKGSPPRWPADARPTIATAMELLRDPIRPIPGVDPDLMALLLTALADEPTDRPTAAQFRDRLAALDLPDAAAPAPTTPPAPAPTTPPAPAPTTPPAPTPRRRRPLVVMAALAALVALAVVTTMAIRTGLAGSIGGTSPPAATVGPVRPPATASALPSSSSPTPTPPGPTASGTIPPGFVDCSPRFGAGTYCVTTQECWGGLVIYADLPALGTAQDCDKNHVYQTFAAGELASDVRRQSQLETDRQVRRVCRKAVVNSMLAVQERRADWEVYALPPRQLSTSETFYRCIFGRGERSEPLRLVRPA